MSDERCLFLFHPFPLLTSYLLAFRTLISYVLLSLRSYQKTKIWRRNEDMVKTSLHFSAISKPPDLTSEPLHAPCRCTCHATWHTRAYRAILSSSHTCNTVALPSCYTTRLCIGCCAHHAPHTYSPTTNLLMNPARPSLRSVATGPLESSPNQETACCRSPVKTSRPWRTR